MKPRAGEIDRALGALIRREREKQGLSQTDVATQLGKSWQMQAKYEAGSCRMAASTLFRVCDMLGLDVAEIKARVHDRPSVRTTAADRAAWRLARLGRRLAGRPEVLETIVNVATALVAAEEKSSDHQRLSCARNTVAVE